MTFTFAEIRRAYEDIMGDFSRWIETPDLRDKIAEDLDYWGMDNEILLEELIEKYSLKQDGFDYLKHFEDEGELVTLEATLLAPLRIAGWIVWYLYERAFPGGCKQPKWLEVKTENPRLDLTVGDLITWRLTGNFCLRETANIRVG